MGSLERSLQTAFPSYYKCARVDAAAAPEDRLSELPDCLLHEILCRLGSRQVAQTGTLSRRWRHVWRSTHCLHIDQREFPGSDEPSSPRHAPFEDFADGILAAFAGVALPLYEFDQPAPGRRQVHGLREVDAPRPRAPPGQRRHQLQLSCQRHRQVAASAPRHGRRRLPPHQPPALWRDSTRRLPGAARRAQCPVLESLRLYWCHHKSNCAIFSPTLKSLEVIFRASYSYPVTLAIAAPRLASLHLRIQFSGEGGSPVITAPGHDALPSLVTASIQILDQDRGPSQRANKTKLEFLRSMRGFLARLSNVTNLHLWGFTTTALLDHESQEFPVFRNMRELGLTLCDVGAINSEVLLRILEAGTPTLEKLGLLLCKFSGRPRSRKEKTVPNGTPSKRRASTLFEHENLSSVEINCLPHQIPHWDKIYSKYLRKTPKGMHPRLVKKLNLSSSEGEVYTDAGTAPLGGLTLSLYHRANITRIRWQPLQGCGLE